MELTTSIYAAQIITAVAALAGAFAAIWSKRHE